ncbi:hypothetical protein [Tsukamurella sputi]|uniref:hypothetical protein n=1 Tax=Tsukamurella sputi TaxID=2591848 RepID=UPI0019611B46|nr:hypothetical protein [Tsukamurella sputi]
MTTTQPQQRPSASKIFTVSGFGTAMEYYDFSIYGLAAALVFPKIFFPDSARWWAPWSPSSPSAPGSSPVRWAAW